MSAVLCLMMFLMGIPLVMQGGIYVFQIMDWYCALLALMTILIVECIVIGWMYGTTRFYKDIEMMIGFQPCKLWAMAWKFSTPCFFGLMLMFNMGTITPVSYKTYQYPPWAIGIGWIIGLSSIIPIPFYMVLSLWRSEGTFLEKLKANIRPAPSWGPALEINRNKYSISLQNPEDKTLL